MTDKRKDWLLRPYNETLAKQLEESLGISAFLARLLVNRNVSSIDEARQFLNVDASMIHNPFLLKDIDQALETLLPVIQNKKKICIYGDYDVDGAVGTSMLWLFFRELGLDAGFYIPNRMREGYSLNKSALAKLKEQGTDLLITVDNGIMAVAEVAYANSIGLQVIITDHHQVGPILPAAAAVINPQRKDCPYPFKGICGAGVAFKLMMAIRQRLRSENFFETHALNEPHLKKYLAWLAIATVCDVVPLIHENRYFVREGLRQLQHSTHCGLQELLRVCQLDSKPIRSGDLGFKIGPRINACGRLDDAEVGVRLLTTNDPNEAKNLAKLLNDLNQERRDIELGIVNEAVDRVESMIPDPEQLSLVLFDESWHEGVVGIVASRLVDRFGRPAFVLTRTENGLIKGSGRSISKVSLITALRECENLLVKFGGHEAAAGVTLEADRLPEFQKAFELAVRNQIAPEDLRRVVHVDEILNVNQIDDSLFEDLNRLEPHGMSNARPVFASFSTRIIKKRIVGEEHLKLDVSDGRVVVDAIAFRKAGEMNTIAENDGLIFNLEKNSFNNRERVQLLVQEFVKYNTVKPTKQS